jgi:hypothetical protein
VPASLFVFVTADDRVDATGTLTLDTTELSFTARAV